MIFQTTDDGKRTGTHDVLLLLDRKTDRTFTDKNQLVAVMKVVFLTNGLVGIGGGLKQQSDTHGNISFRV